MVKQVRATGITNGSGLCTLQIKIPGSFAGISPVAINGRTIIEARAFFGNGAPGDYLTNLQVVDIDGVVPVPARPQFPMYPILGTRNDTADLVNLSGRFMPPGDTTDFVPDKNKNAYVPGAVYISIDFVAVDNRSDTVYLSLFWDDGT